VADVDNVAAGVGIADVPIPHTEGRTRSEAVTSVYRHLPGLLATTL